MAVKSRRYPAHVPANVIPDGGPLIGQEYFLIYDQTGTLWAWWISPILMPDWKFQPEHSFDQIVRFYILPWWVKIVGDDDLVYYAYPAVDGSPILDATQPPLGDGITGSPKLRVRGGTRRYQYTVVGGMLDVA